MLKTCSKCKISKELEEFNNCKSYKDGKSYICKICRALEWENDKINRKIYKKQHYKLNKHKAFAYTKNKYHTNPLYKLSQLLRIRLLDALKGKNNKTISVIELIGCSIEEFKQYLENQFYPEMTWENHGKIWEIDHIKGCNNFDLMNLDEQKECFHYSNHQPLFKTTEIAKIFGYDNIIGNRDKKK